MSNFTVEVKCGETKYFDMEARDHQHATRLLSNLLTLLELANIDEIIIKRAEPTN